MDKQKKFKAINDYLIEELLTNKLYKITKDGMVKTKIGYNGKPTKRWRTAGYINTNKNKSYVYMKYKNKDLKVHRIVYAKWKGPLDQELVVNHKDGNGLNNEPDNLELVTWEYNSSYR